MWRVMVPNVWKSAHAWTIAIRKQSIITPWTCSSTHIRDEIQFLFHMPAAAPLFLLLEHTLGNAMSKLPACHYSFRHYPARRGNTSVDSASGMGWRAAGSRQAPPGLGNRGSGQWQRRAIAQSEAIPGGVSEGQFLWQLFPTLAALRGIDISSSSELFASSLRLGAALDANWPVRGARRASRVLVLLPHMARLTFSRARQVLLVTEWQEEGED